MRFLPSRSWDGRGSSGFRNNERKESNKMCLFPPPPQTNFIFSHFVCVGHLKCMFVSMPLSLSPSLSLLRRKVNVHTLVDDILAWKMAKDRHIYQAQPFPCYKNWSLELQQILCVTYCTRKWEEVGISTFGCQMPFINIFITRKDLKDQISVIRITWKSLKN